MNAYLSEFASIAATIDPQLLDGAAATSDWVDCSLYRKITFIVNVGATDIAFNAKLQEATSDAGADAQDITGFAITPLGASDDNEQVVLEINTEEVSEGFTHVALVATAGNGVLGVNVSAVGLGYDARYEPVEHLASVTQIV